MEVSQTSNVFRSHHVGGIQKATITSQTSLDLCLRQTLLGKSRVLSLLHRFRKAPFLKFFRQQENQKLAFSDSFGLSVFKKLRFRVDGRPI